MSSTVKTIEELFLNFFKITVLCIMILALLATIGLSGYAIYLYSQSPKETAPAQKAPEKDPAKEINLYDLMNYLIEQEKQKNTPTDTSQTLPGNRQSARFLEDATTLYRCSGDFATKLGLTINETNDEFLQRVGKLRSELEEKANNPLRGEKWVNSVVAFSCNALGNDSLISLKKEKKVGSVFYPLLKFHINAWDKIQNDKIQFEKKEEERVNTERNAEAYRVSKAKALAITCLSAAACSFGMFMFLAIYLLFSKIESNLRDIKDSVRAKRVEASPRGENDQQSPI